MARLVLAIALFSGVVVHDGFAQDARQNLRGYTMQVEDGAVYAVPPRGRSLPKLRYACRFSCRGVGIVAYSGVDFEVSAPTAWRETPRAWRPTYCGSDHADLRMRCNGSGGDASPRCAVSVTLFDLSSNSSAVYDCSGIGPRISSSGVSDVCVRQRGGLALECRFVPQNLASARSSPWSVAPPVRGGTPDQIIAQNTAAASHGDSARAKPSDSAKVSAPAEPATAQGNAAPATE